MDYSYSAHSVPDGVFNFMLAMGEVAFSYAGHNVVLEIQATIPSTPDNPSKKAMWKGVVVAYIGVAFCYLPVAFIGYYVYGNSVDDNILITLERPTWLIAAANIFVIVHVIGGYQVFSMPVFDMIETFLVKQMKLPPSLILRLFARTAFVGTRLFMSELIFKYFLNFYILINQTFFIIYIVSAFTMIVGICIPFFGSLLGFLGGFAFAPTSYFVSKRNVNLFTS